MPDLSVSWRSLLKHQALAVGGREAGAGEGGKVSVGGGQHLRLTRAHNPLVQMLKIITHDCSFTKIIGW